MTSKAYRDNYGAIDWSKQIDLPMRQHIALARSSLPCPMIISDVMDPVQSMLDGNIYDSKSAIRATYRQAGVTEIGNDKPPPFKRAKPKRADIRTTIEKASARWNRGERA